MTLAYPHVVVEDSGDQLVIVQTAGVRAENRRYGRDRRSELIPLGALGNGSALRKRVRTADAHRE
jgi:hypothetical protein